MAPVTNDAPGPDAPPVWIAWLLAALGAAVVAAAILGPDASLRAPRWVVALAGATFVGAGFLARRAPASATRRAIDRFVVAALLTMFSVLGAWVALFAAGPFTVSAAGTTTTTDGVLPRIAFGIGAALTGVAAAFAWRAWRRAVRELDR